MISAGTRSVSKICVNKAERDAEIVRRYQAGESGTRIALDLHISGPTVYKALDEAGIRRQRQGDPHQQPKPSKRKPPAPDMGRFLCPWCDAGFWERRTALKTHTECDQCGRDAFVEPFPALMVGVRLAELIERLEAEGWAGAGWEAAELEEAA